MTDLAKFVPIESVAKHFMVSISTARAWVRQGHIPPDTYLKIGNTYRFDLQKVVDALTNRQHLKQKPIVVSEKEGKEPQQLELDFGNPDEDI